MTKNPYIYNNYIINGILKLSTRCENNRLQQQQQHLLFLWRVDNWTLWPVLEEKDGFTLELQLYFNSELVSTDKLGLGGVNCRVSVDLTDFTYRFELLSSRSRQGKLGPL